MSLTRSPRGGEVHASAVERLEAAQRERSRLRVAVDDARGTVGEPDASARLGEAAERVAAREAWLGWVERGV
jgi:hypothetical protein